MKTGWMYIYKQIDGKLVFQKSVKMIGFLDRPTPIPATAVGCFSQAEFKKDSADYVDGQTIYEVWFPAYLEQHPTSVSDLMLEAKITHFTAQITV